MINTSYFIRRIPPSHFQPAYSIPEVSAGRNFFFLIPHICISNHARICYNGENKQGGTLMSRADQIFKENCRDILQNGVWDTDQQVRPHWDDGTPAHTVKKFGIVNRYDLREEFPILTVRRTFSRPASTSCCGSGSRSPTTSTTCGATSGTAGRMRTAPSARPTAISWR